MPSLIELPAAGAVSPADQLVINVGNSTTGDRRAPASLLGLPQSPAGLTAKKTNVPHAESTAAFVIEVINNSIVTHAHLVSLQLSGPGRLATVTYLVTVAYSTATVTELGKSLFGFASVAMYTYINTSTGGLVLFINQANYVSAASDVVAHVLPLIASDDGYITLAAVE